MFETIWAVHLHAEEQSQEEEGNAGGGVEDECAPENPLIQSITSILNQLIVETNERTASKGGCEDKKDL
jgi:hypothetical protein